MANETLYSSAVTVAAAVDASIAPAFIAKAVAARLVAPFSLQGNTNALKLPKSGSLTASVVAEGVAATPQTVSDTSVTLTIQKAVVVTKPTAEYKNFTNAANVARHSALAADACARKFDTDMLALAASVTAVVDSTSAQTVAKLAEAAYTVRTGNCPSDKLAAVLHYKQMWQLAADTRTQTGAYFGNPNFNPTALAGDGGQPAGFRGNLLGIDVYESGLTYVDTAPTPDDNVALVFAPDLAFAALFPAGQTQPGFETSISTELGFLESVDFIKTLMWYQIGIYNNAAACRITVDI